MKPVLSRLGVTLSTRTALAISTAVLAVGLGGFVMVDGAPAASHQPIQLNAGDQSQSSSQTSDSDTSDSDTSEASATAEASTNGSSTSNHGDAVTAAVASCKAALQTGQHGIGQCVAPVASGGRHTAPPTPGAVPSH